MKYSKGFESSYDFYLRSTDFDFCGTLIPKYVAIHDTNGRSAKECFYLIESEGRNVPCSEPELLTRLLLTKASVNFQIKQWAEGVADGTLPIMELSKRFVFKNIKCTLSEIKQALAVKTLEWINGEPVYFRDIQKQYSLPDWVIEATVNQEIKLRRQSI